MRIKRASEVIYRSDYFLSHDVWSTRMYVRAPFRPAVAPFCVVLACLRPPACAREC